jgi:hypothetical protein
LALDRQQTGIDPALDVVAGTPSFYEETQQ